MGILELIEDDHKKIEALLAEAQDNSNDKRKRNDLITQIKNELLPHNRAEESLVYKELENRGSKTLIIKSREEHTLIENYLESFQEDLDESSFTAKLEILDNLISTHIDEEEDETFEKLKAEFSEEELDNLGQKFMEEKEQLTPEE